MTTIEKRIDEFFALRNNGCPWCSEERVMLYTDDSSDLGCEPVWACSDCAEEKQFIPEDEQVFRDAWIRSHAQSYHILYATDETGVVGKSITVSVDGKQYVAVVTNYDPGEPAKTSGPPDSCHTGTPSTVDYDLFDDTGEPALDIPWRSEAINDEVIRVCDEAYLESLATPLDRERMRSAAS